MKNISILGSTGSIGKSALRVIDETCGKFNVIGLSANQNVDLLIEQCAKYRPKVVAIGDEKNYKTLKQSISKDIEVCCGGDGFIRVSTHSDNDMVLAAIVGTAGLPPVYEAIKKGIDIAIANKEVLVMAGELITRLAKEKKSTLLPVDSEHSALFQCLRGEKKEWVRKLILTASGGPFLNTPKSGLSNVTVDQALAHPKWSMGRKISIDSATMMNKGLEVIEARWLFSVDIDSIDVIIHPESIIHSMVEFIDGSHIAQLGCTDMAIPIQYALAYPDRIEGDCYRGLDFNKISSLTFKKPDYDKFPCLRLAYEAGKIGESMPAVMNAANEEAVNLFLSGKIGFMDIPKIIENVMIKHDLAKCPEIETLAEADKWARDSVVTYC